MDNSVNSPRRKVLRRKLKEARLKAKLTQTALGEILGKGQSFVSKIELGDRKVETTELEFILSALGVDTEQFLKEVKAALDKF
jgi:transcriptional regulator with XRE-family HTH domain